MIEYLEHIFKLEQSLRDMESRLCSMEYELRQEEAAHKTTEARLQKAEQEVAASSERLQIGVGLLKAKDEAIKTWESRAKQAEEALREARQAIKQCLGGMGPGSSIWGTTQYDKGWANGITAALCAFDSRTEKALSASTPTTPASGTDAR